MAYGYNDAGLRTSTAATIDGVADYVDEYAYDSQGRLVSIAQYGAAGGNAMADKQISLTYNDQGLLATVTRYTDGNLAVLAQYSYDSASHDSAGQLLAATYSTGQAAEAYSYDANGNRVTADGAAYLTGPNNQLLFDGVFSYSYDPEGNRTARFIDCNANGLLDAGDTAATTYAWDHRNRLTRVTDYDLYGDPATRAIDYLYDLENRWIGRDVDLDADGQIDTRTRFAYDGNQIVLQFDRAAAPTGDPADPLTIDHLSHRYLWNPAAVDQLMADEHVTTPDSPGTILWPLADHLGTIRDLAAYDSSTDATTVVNHRTFDAYGNLQSQTNAAVDCLFAFTGRPLDQDTSLQNNLHRWYDPAVGRWMSEDPIGFEGRDANLYAYVGNGPVNAVDPSGQATPKELVPPIGQFTITVHQVTVGDPSQQRALGTTTIGGFTVTYIAPAGYTIPSGYQFVLVQAIQLEGMLLGVAPKMDIGNKKLSDFDHRVLPPYSKNTKMKDSPYNTRNPGGGSVWRGTICAVAQRAVPTGTDDEIVLGAINYVWYDKADNQYLIAGGKTLRYVKHTRNTDTFAAEKPGPVWYTALGTWNAFKP